MARGQYTVPEVTSGEILPDLTQPPPVTVLAAIDTATGSTVWSTALAGAPIPFRLELAGDELVMSGQTGACEGMLAAITFDALSGTERSRASAVGLGGAFAPSGLGSIGSDERIDYDLDERSGALFAVAVDHGTGVEAWAVQLVEASQLPPVSIRYAQSLLVDGVIFIAVHANPQGCRVSFGD